MADKKISALSAASTPLVGSEVLPIVQSGATVKVSVADLTAGRTTAMSLLDVENSTGGGLLGTFKSNWSTTKLSVVADGVTGSAVLDVSNLGGTLPYGFKVKANGTETLDVDTSGNVKATIGNLVLGTAGKGIDFSANTHAAGMTSELLNDYEEGTWTPDFAAWTTVPSVIFATYTKIGRQVTVTLYANDGVNAGAQPIAGLPFTSSASSAGAAFGSSSDITSIIRGSVIQSSTFIANFPTNNLTGQFWQIVAVYFA